jgi:branched-chain amino acid transport system substrate-binding protein
LVVSSISIGAVVCEARDSIKIGVAGPLKFSWGKNMVAGAQVGAEEINAKGGVLVGGKRLKIEIIAADSNDYMSVVDAVNTCKRLITVDKVDFLDFGARTETGMAQMEVAAEYKMVSMLGGGGSPAFVEPIRKNYERYKYVFNPLPLASEQSKVYLSLLHMAATKIRKELGITKINVALVMEKAKWTEAVAEAAKTILPKMGLEVVGLWKPSPMETDMTAALTDIEAKEAHIIYEVFTGPAAIILNKQVGEYNLPVAVLGLNLPGGAMGRQYWEETNGMCAYEVTLGSNYRAVQINEKSKPVFNKVFEKLGNKMPTITSFTQYDNILILKEAIERAGTLRAEAVVEELTKTDYIGPNGRIVFNSKDSKYPNMAKFGPEYITFTGYQWRNGEMLCVWPDGVRSPLLEDPAWEGLRYEGTVEYELPPRIRRHLKK